MSKRDSAPTHGWIISSQVNKWLALIFILILIPFSVAVWTVTYTVRRNCNDVWERDLEIGNYWIHLESGSTKKECPQYGD